jgi:AcrR family transcriptional regulator
VTGTGTAPTHRRGAAVQQSILDVTLGLLASRGYAFSVDEVAAECGVHKTTIYRRWPSKPELVAAAIDLLAARTIHVRRTDDPLDDLRDLAVQVAAALGTDAGRNALVAALAAAGSDPDLRATVRRFFDRRYADALPLIERAVDEGLVRADVDPTLLWQAVVNPLHLDAVCGRTTSHERAVALVDLVVSGAAPRT